MTNTKWLRRALLGGVALSVMATSAHAGELLELKAQLEALQSRVNTLEATPAQAALPDGYSYMTYARGMGSNDDWANESKTDAINQSNTRGFTIAVTPTADLPAPVAEVTVYGYVKGDVIYSFEDNNFAVSTGWSVIGGENNDDHITIHAKQSRFGIKSKIDTSIGQLRTRIEGDFEGGAYGSTDDFRLRHAYGEWDMTPNLTLIVGQTWRVAALLPLGISTVNFFGTSGWTYSRDPQVKLRYTYGPMTVHLGIEEPISRTSTNIPVFGGSMQYDIPGGHQLVVGAAVGETAGTGVVTTIPAVIAVTADPTATPPIVGVVGVPSYTITHKDEITWVIQGGFNINLADVATVTAAATYGAGSVLSRYQASPFARHAAFSNSGLEALGLMAGVSVPITDTTTVNLVWDYLDGDSGSLAGNTAAAALGGSHDQLHTIHANVFWQPVRQMRMGWEVQYMTAGSKTAGSTMKDEAMQLQWGTWFFF